MTQYVTGFGNKRVSNLLRQIVLQLAGITHSCSVAHC